MSRHTRKYQALVAPLPGAGKIAAGAASWPATWSGVVRAVDHATGASQWMTALVATPEGAEPPRKSPVPVTMVVVGPGCCLDIGDAFTLWQGTDIARGVVTRRMRLFI